MTAATPYHLRQLERTLPNWSRQLPGQHVSAMLSTQRKEYLQDNGQPCAWYAQASAAQRQALHHAIHQRNHSRSALHSTLSPLKGITEFCKPLLQARLGLDVPVDEAVYFFQPFKRRPTVHAEPEAGLGTGREPDHYEYDPEGTPRKVSLLEAALHNFTDSAEAGPYSLLQRSRENPARLVGFTTPSFIEACRELDLGKHYQNHLVSVYDGAAQHTLAQQSSQASRDELLVQAWIALMRGKLSSAGLQALERLCAGNSSQPPACWRISLEQTPLHEVLVIAPLEAEKPSPRLVYIPGAHDFPLVEYPTASAAASDLTKRLQEQRLLQHIVRFAPQPLQAQLARRLHRQLFDTLQPPNLPAILPKPSARLRYQATPLPVQPWHWLYQAHVTRLKADAATLAVPTAQVDASARLERLEHWLSVGLDLANVAALFLPGLNTIMLAIGGAQLMGSVFHGIEAWEDDNKAEAAAQLESVLLNLAFIGAVGGAAALLKQSRFVDSLLPIKHEAGERLWQPDLTPYASPQVLPEALEANEQGQYQHAQRHFIRLDGALHEHSQAPSGHWHIHHPQDALAYRPPVRHLGQGAWRVVGEQPLDWSPAQLLRRIGPAADGLSDAELATALRCTGIDENVLRQVHVSETPTPALLSDAIARLAADRQTSELMTRIRHGLSITHNRQYALNGLVELPGWPRDHVLKVFDGAEHWGHAVVYGDSQQASPVVVELTRSDLEHGRLSHAVLGQLSEQAASALLPEATLPASRPRALDELLAEHLTARRNALLDALYQSRQIPLDSAAVPLQRQFPSLPNQALNAIVEHASSAERVRMASGRIPLRIAEEARAHQAHGRLNRALLGLYRPALSNTDSQRLAAGLLAEHPGASAAECLERALDDRQHAAHLIGQQPIRPGYRSPLRLTDGRVGYPLSGRGGWRSWIRRGGENIEERRLQELYPTLDVQQRRTLLGQLSQRGNVAEQLAHLQRERETLDQSLRAWCDAADGEERRNRRAFGAAMRRAARQEGGNRLQLTNLALGSLPSLPARFDHITIMHIHNIGLRNLPEHFLQSFPQLRRLRLTANPALQADSLFSVLHDSPQLHTLEVIGSPLVRLDAAALDTLASLRRLRGLRLRDAGLSITDAELQVLTQLPLEELDLASNQIALPPDLAARFGEMPLLRELDLSHNPLGNAPGLANLHRLRNLLLNECSLTTWPEELTTLMNRPDFTLRNLDLSSNMIHDLPDLETILASRYARELLTSHAQRWEFHFNNLPQGTARQLRAAGVGVVEQAAFLPETVAVDWRAEANARHQQLWDDLFAQGDNRHLREVVERVGRSAQALDNSQSLAREVWHLLQAASQDQALLEHLDEVASDFPPSCGDAGTDGFSTLQVEQMAYAESAQANIRGPYLFQFYRRLFRREQVNALAARIQAARLQRQAVLQRWAQLPLEERPAHPHLPALDILDDIGNDELLEGGLDDIEIRLALRQALASQLNFPEPSQDMLYRNEAHVSENTVDEVAFAVEAVDERPTERRAWITVQPSWRRFIRRQFSQYFTALDERWYRGIEYVDYCLDPEATAVTTLDERVRERLVETLPDAVPDASGTLPRLNLDSQQYNDALRQLASGRQAEEDTLYLRLTAEQDPNDHD